MSSRRSERPRKRPTPIDAHYDSTSVTSGPPRSASSATGSTARLGVAVDDAGVMTAGDAGPSVQRRKARGGKARARGRKGAPGEREGEADGQVQDEGVFEPRENGDEPLREDSVEGDLPSEKGEEEEEEDPVWQEFSQEYYEVVEQLPLEIHRNFALLRELDDQTQRQTGQLLELIRRYVVRRLPSPIPEELEVPLPVVQAPNPDAADRQQIPDAENGEGSDGRVAEPAHEGVENVENASEGKQVTEAVEDGVRTAGQAQDLTGQSSEQVDRDAPATNGHAVPETESKTSIEPNAEVAIEEKPTTEDIAMQDAVDSPPGWTTLPDGHAALPNETDSANTQLPTTNGHVATTANGHTPQVAQPAAVAAAASALPTSAQRIETLRTRQAEMYAHNLVPAMASRVLLPEIGKLARDMLRSADEKVGIAIGTYNTVDRHIRSLDAALQAQQAALNLGIRQDTLPSKAVTGSTTATTGAGEPLTMQAGGKADVPGGGLALALDDQEQNDERRIGKNWRKGLKGQHRQDRTRAVDALNVGLSTTAAGEDKSKGKQKAGKVVGEPEPIVLGYMAAHNFDLAIDPNEPRYCFCQNVSYGEMVGCEASVEDSTKFNSTKFTRLTPLVQNLDCPTGGWFHLGCLGMTTAPQGKWWCDQCKPKDKASGQKRKKRKVKF